MISEQHERALGYDLELMRGLVITFFSLSKVPLNPAASGKSPPL
jgi:hypothetical protein